VWFGAPDDVWGSCSRKPVRFPAAERIRSRIAPARGGGDATGSGAAFGVNLLEMLIDRPWAETENPCAPVPVSVVAATELRFTRRRTSMPDRPPALAATRK
jgi:hypothetical protein